MNTLAQGGAVIVIVIGFAVTVFFLERIARDKKEKFPIFYTLLALAYFTCTAGALIGKMFFP